MRTVLTNRQSPKGEIINFNGTPHYHIQHVDRMPSFLMTLVSPYDHWLFQSSHGGMTAGRVDVECALFPYYTDDKLHSLSGQQGPANQFWIHLNDQDYYWRPFSTAQDPFQQVERNLYKHVYGHQVTFEEKHLELGLTFRNTWYASERLGFILQTELINEGQQPVQVEAMTGVRQLLPAGVKQSMQDLRSNLMAAYKKNEWYEQVALYRLSAIPIDRAEPAEALLTNVAWQAGDKVSNVSLRNEDWDAFTHGTLQSIDNETKGDNGAFLQLSDYELAKGETWSSFIVFDTQYQAHQVLSLAEMLAEKDLLSLIQAEIEKTHQDMLRLLASTDGLQVLGDKATQYRHANNVMFNNMRGGILFNYTYCPLADVSAYLKSVNAPLAAQFSDWLIRLPDPITLPHLHQAAAKTGNSDLIRLLNDYMPIGFSRRHGDPSRPWNTFHIHIKDARGYNVLYYEGNWRDIFQNWEALSHSYPALLPGMVSKFWNATTIDGYNPYRIEKNGVDWEVLEPHDDWSYVGYWGDHQIVYQTKLLERWQATAPGDWLLWLDKRWFVCPDVPYRIGSNTELLQNAADTISFDQEAHQKALERSETIGFDGKNRVDEEGQLLKVSGLEKILITLSAKLDNLIPGVGIWMNTQRPEWNDANNALVGRGASAVTVYQLRKHIAFLQDHLGQAEIDCFNVGKAIADHWQSLMNSLAIYQENENPQAYLYAALQAGSDYRTAAYSQSLGEPVIFQRDEFVNQLGLCLSVLDATIIANKREDGLYHSYHLVQTDGTGLASEPLYLMLEGQAAVLDAGVLQKTEGLQLLQSIKDSDLYEPHQNSYLLYPNRSLPLFMERNRLPKGLVEESPWLKELLTVPEQNVLVKDINEEYHFHANAINQQALEQEIAPYKALSSWTKAQEDVLLNEYEAQFNHSAFTGRSGTFYGYEGLGSIYWHMVSKLVLGTQQELIRWDVGITSTEDKAMRKLYADLRAGIGWNKPPDVYGAVPLDPYSHTPYLKGARQPGMTGQVKEDIISRYGDLGIQVSEGQISFQPNLLPEHWFTDTKESFYFPNLSNQLMDLTLPENCLAYTYGGVLVVYYKNQRPTSEQLVPIDVELGQSIELSVWEGMRGKWVCIPLNE